VPDRPGAASALANNALVVGDDPHPAPELGAVAVGCEYRSSRRPCHPRAISNGRERYPAVSHGNYKEAVELRARP
jgi:hypothetical protein